MTNRMPPPAWHQVIVHPEGKAAPVGDPTLWAGQVTTPIDSAPEGNTPRVIQGAQIVMAQARDRYSRSWSLSGVVTLPQAAWNGSGPGVASPPSFPDPAGGPAGTPLEVWISVLQGIEHITVEHLILLMSGGTGSGHAWGLCNQQATSNPLLPGAGGPYGATFTSPLAEQGQQGRAFAIIGGLIGNTISVRGIFVRGPGGIVPNASINCMLTPYAPGAGI